MPSLSARLFGTILRLTGSITKQFAGGPGMGDVIRAARAAPLPVPTDKMRATLDVREEQVDGRSVWHIAPRGAAPRGHLLYFHGGGYIFTASPFHWSMLGALAEKHGIAITAPLYPLAPEHGVAETTAFANAIYRRYLDDHAGPFVLGGDSAGAGLAAATAMAARDAGLRLPSGLLLISPWLDGEALHPDQPRIERRDCILRLRGIRDAAVMYARDVPVTDPRVSPIHGDWSGLPPILAFGGGDDILVVDGRALKAKLPAVDYDERAGLMHDWPIFTFPESKQAQARMGEFIAAAG